ncbi:MAG: putative peptidoglycan glycosyltransferase FtsW [Chloroflexota bacterium]
MGIGVNMNRASQRKSQSALSIQGSKTMTEDIPLILVVVALAVLGLLMVYSASTDFSLLAYDNPTYIFNKQLLWMAIGIVVAFVVSRFDYHIWTKFALPVMAATIGLLVAVLINNEVRLGAVRSFFGGSVQPSELAKLAIVIYLSVWMYSKKDILGNVQLGLTPLAVILGAVGGLIYIQPDLSATATIFILGGLLFFLAGGELRQIVLFLVVALIAGWLVVQFSDTGQQRLGPYLAGLKDPLDADYHVRRSLEAIVRGGFFGAGIGNAITKVTGLPVPPTDSIFAVVAEELGLFGSIVLIGLYLTILWRGLRIAAKAPDMFGRLLASGLTFWIVIEAFINMAVMVGLLPFAGNALPFISAGGSNLLSSLTAIGILLSISRMPGKTVPVKDEQRRTSRASIDLRRWDRRRRKSRPRRPAGNQL